ncbi:acyl carrier protein [Stenotrophomonas indicatrix]|uniref:acyl carrier protein n=1 Tax=Stenotrophomonas indicatrix TaxID=2045451 RepID=UPI0030083452
MSISAADSPSIRTLIAQVGSIAEVDIRTQDRLSEDLRIDSLDMAALLLDIEQFYGVVVDGPTVQLISTVGQLEALVGKSLGGRP